MAWRPRYNEGRTFPETTNAPEGVPSDAFVGVVARVGIEPTTFRFSGGRSYQLSYLALRPPAHPVNTECAGMSLATLTGLEPATSAVTGRRANQLRHRAVLFARERTLVDRRTFAQIGPLPAVSEHVRVATEARGP